MALRRMILAVIAIAGGDAEASPQDRRRPRPGQRSAASAGCRSRSHFIGHQEARGCHQPMRHGTHWLRPHPTSSPRRATSRNPDLSPAKLAHPTTQDAKPRIGSEAMASATALMETWVAENFAPELE
jgi:hypothetical protein